MTAATPKGANMDEAEKYQQRLQAIAEKRRMQEEQERAKRDVEDERLRLQQLKRKSLRDQWLMEGPLSSPASPASPTSPTSPFSQESPHSPLWGPHTPETEKRIDELQEEGRRLAEGKQLKEQTEDGKREALHAAEATEDVLQNGREKPTRSDAVEDAGTTVPSVVPDKAPVLLTNGGTGGEAQTNHFALEMKTSGPGTTEPVAVSDSLAEPVAVSHSLAEPVAVSHGNTEPVAGSDGNTEPVAVSHSLAEPVAVSHGNTEPVAISDGNTEPVAVSHGNAEPVAGSDGTIATALLGYVHTEPGPTPDIGGGGDEDEGILVMRAERVIIVTDDDLPPQGQEEEEEEEKQQQQQQQQEEEEKEEEQSALLDAATREVGGEAVGGTVEAAVLEANGVAPQGGQHESSEAAGSVTAETAGAAGDTPTAGGQVSIEEGKEEVTVATAPSSDPSLQSPAGTEGDLAASEPGASDLTTGDPAIGDPQVGEPATGDPAVASVPTYSEGPPSLRLGPEGETATEVVAPAAEAAAAEAAAPGGGASEPPSVAQPPTTSAAGQFQDVPLVEPPVPAAQPGEQEPLLRQAKAPQTKAGGLGASEAHRGPPPRAEARPANSRGGDEVVSPKQKTCQCCSIM